MNFLKSIFKFVIIFILALSFSNISNSVEKNYYKDLITDWSRIFPDSNRNAAGPKFFKYIIDKDIKIQIKWTNGKTKTISVKELNRTITLNQ